MPSRRASNTSSFGHPLGVGEVIASVVAAAGEMPVARAADTGLKTTLEERREDDEEDGRMPELQRETLEEWGPEQQETLEGSGGMITGRT